MAQFHWDPDSYLELMHTEIPDYERLQDETAAAAGGDVTNVLELGIGTGETTRRVLAANPDAHVTGLDASPKMLARAAAALPSKRVKLVLGRLEDPLPAGPFDAVISTLCIHHLKGPGKADLFRRISRRLTPSGRLVLGDLIVPEDPSDVVTPIDGEYDSPSGIEEQTRWLAVAGLLPRVHWAHKDLAVLVGEVPREAGRGW